MAQSKRAKVANYLCRLNFRAPLGSANKIKSLMQVGQLVSNNCPISVYGQAWTAHESAAGTVEPGSAGGPRRASNLPQRRGWVLRSSHPPAKDWRDRG